MKSKAWQRWPQARVAATHPLIALMGYLGAVLRRQGNIGSMDVRHQPAVPGQMSHAPGHEREETYAPALICEESAAGAARIGPGGELQDSAPLPT
jgi:hypothetical protein